jgi:hypothetical protein
MFHCKPLSMLPIQSTFDSATAEGDTVLVPQQHFEQLFDEEFGGGILGIRITYNESIIYASCAPQSDDNNVYMPDWMLSMLREKSMNFDEDLTVDIEKAGHVHIASTIRVRRVDTEIEVDMQKLLQEFLYDCKYIQPNTVFHLPFSGMIIDLVVEAVIDEDGFEMEVGLLGSEVNLDIQDPISTPPPEPSAPFAEDPGPCPMIVNDGSIPYALPAYPIGYVMPAMVFVPSTIQSTPIHSLDELRRMRLAYYNALGGGPANVANSSGQYTGAGNS